MPSKKNKELAEKITREIASKLLVRAFMNAAALLDAAKTLVAAGHFGLARSQAISAREEVGKGFTAGSFLAGQVSAEELVETLRSHNYKQAEGLIAPFLAGRLKDPASVLTMLGLNVNATPAEFFATVPGKLAAESKELFDQLSPDLDVLRSSRELAEGGLHEKARQAGIYVSLELDDGDIHLEYPQQITAAQAEEEIGRFEWLLTAFSGLTGRLPSELWSDDEGAERFSQLAATFFRPGLFSPPPEAVGNDD